MSDRKKDDQKITDKEIRDIFQLLIGASQSLEKKKLSLDDICSTMSRLGIEANPRVVSDLFPTANKSGNGEVSYEEFADAMRDVGDIKETRKEIEDAFRMFQGREVNEGCIDIGRLQEWLLLYDKETPEQELKDLLMTLPVDEDGQFEISEYLNSIFPESGPKKKKKERSRSPGTRKLRKGVKRPTSPKQP